jgi:hypothetical protein
VTSEPNSTPAPFQPNDRRWLKRFNAVEILVVLLGLAACSLGMIGMVIGVPMVLAAIYSAVFIPPKVNRGLYIGKCPHCGADMSATHYQTQVDCPSCAGDVAIRNSRFVAVPKSASQIAA